MSDFAPQVDWYTYEPPAPKVIDPVINVKSKSIYVNTQAYQHILTNHAQIGFYEGKLILKPIDIPEGQATNPSIIAVCVRQNGQVQINIPKHFRKWLDDHNISGKYIVAYSEDYKWVYTKEKVE